MTAAFAPERLMLDDRIRGVPPGTLPFPATEVGALDWHPAEGKMALPVLTLDETAFAANRDMMFAHVRRHGALIAPHAKTPMSPDLQRMLVEAGAWGTTVADIRQAAVMLDAGLNRLIVANEVGGSGGARRLAALAASRPAADLHVFADSVAAVDALAAAWPVGLPPLKVLVETGGGRAGARTIAAAEAVAEAVFASAGRLALAGLATYEGAVSRPTPAETDAAMAGLLAMTAALVPRIRARMAAQAPMVVTAGGSSYFDRVLATLGPVVRDDGAAMLVLRSGAIFFNDHGLYDRALAALDQRAGFEGSARAAFRPALRVWAEVLSRPEPDLAICGMGMRDVSFDQGFPVALASYRGGKVFAAQPPAKVTKLNDQHAFLAIAPGSDMAVGDVIEFGISHPCTCLDRYRMIFGTDGAGRVRHAYPTYFG